MEINKGFPKGRSLFYYFFIMGLIKINNIIYGSNNSADIIYKNTTVEEKLNSIPIFDPSDNANIEANYDFLSYGHIIDNLNSNNIDKVLSANQGRVLKETINDMESNINFNIQNVENKIDNFQVAKTITQVEYDALPEEEKNNGIYVIEDEGNVFAAKNIEYDGSETGLGATVQQAIDKIDEKIPFKFGIDSNGNYGYVKEGADSVIPFKRDMKNVIIQFNGSSIKNLTIGKTYFIAMGNFQSTKNTGTISAGAEVLYSSNWVGSSGAYNNYYYMGRFYIAKATATTITFANMNTGWSHVIYFDMNDLVFDNITY